jgi:hypothetical protein
MRLYLSLRWQAAKQSARLYMRGDSLQSTELPRERVICFPKRHVFCVRKKLNSACRPQCTTARTQLNTSSDACGARSNSSVVSTNLLPGATSAEHWILTVPAGLFCGQIHFTLTHQIISKAIHSDALVVPWSRFSLLPWSGFFVCRNIYFEKKTGMWL